MNEAFENDTQDLHILIAEDSPTQAAGLKAILAEQWNDVRWASDGAKALHMMRQCKPALVISDIEMPVLTGYEMSRLVKGDAALKHIPVILLTELASPNAIAQAVDSKADCLLMKPYDPERLLAVIDRVLDEARGRCGHDGGAAADAHCEIAADREHLRKLLTCALDELADQHQRLIAAEEQLDLVHGAAVTNVASAR